MTVRVVELWVSKDKKSWAKAGEFTEDCVPEIDAFLPLCYKHWKIIWKAK